MEKQKPWTKKAREYLQASLSPMPHELNELDWKLALSEDKARLSQHISAFANQRSGGFFVFGLSPSGEIKGVSSLEVNEIIHKITNIARDGLEPPQKIDHFVDEMAGHLILIVYVEESDQKPAHLRGKGIEFSFIRSGGQTRKMSRQEIANAVLVSRQIRYEELEALSSSPTEVFQLLDCEKFFQFLDGRVPENQESLIDQLVNHKMIYRNNGHCSIANLGAIVAAKSFSKFPGKEKFSVRVIKYTGPLRIETEIEKEFPGGYGVGFQELIQYILSQLPTSEVIKDALRKNVPIYPEIAIRELVANALIHRDFSITTMSPMVEIFSDRMEITNPGTLLPSVSIERIVDVSPESRNEILASMMRRMGICEERGSGIDKALFYVEVFGLPPIKFIDGPNAFKAILYRPRHFKEMSQEERLRACYQHCCLKHASGDRMTNTSFRKRLGLSDSQYALAWRVIDAAVEKALIKSGDPENKSRKYAYYVPAWA